MFVNIHANSVRITAQWLTVTTWIQFLFRSTQVTCGTTKMVPLLWCTHPSL